MAPPNCASTSNVEEEIRALRPVAIIPVIENEESEDESSADENVENGIPPEEELIGAQPEEAPPVEEAGDDAEEVSDSSIAPLTTPATSPTTPHAEHNNPLSGSPVMRTEQPNTFHVGESSRGTVRPRQDDPYVSFAPRQRISDPYRMTVPRDDTSVLYSLSGGPYFPPTPPTHPPYNPDFPLQVYRELQTIRAQQRDMLERQVFLEEMSVIESERTRLRMDGFEIEVMRLRSMVRSLSARLTHLENANPGRRM